MTSPRPSRRNPDRAGFGIYIHWPFCAQKCPYCDFNSHVRHGGWDENRFRAAYLRELDETRERLGPRQVTSIFFGGGTPSLMQPATTAAILDRIASLFDVRGDIEITLEANPGSVEAGRFQGYKTAGVNRVSMGFQSFDDDALRRLGRIHTAGEALAAFAIAQRTFERASFDLIYARPGQTIEAWQRELRQALALGTEHLSLYQLTIEPDTPYAALHAAGKLTVPDEDLALALYALTQQMLGDAGLPAYEISNHARPGAESQHNLLYWRYGEYAGIGPGAHGRIIVDGVRRATVAERHPETWCDAVDRLGHGRIVDDSLTPAEQCDEALLMGLRLRDGLSLARLAELAAVGLESKTVFGLEELGLIETIRQRSNEVGVQPSSGLDDKVDAPGETLTHIRATPRGRFILDSIVRELSAALRPLAPVARTRDTSPAPTRRPAAQA